MRLQATEVLKATALAGVLCLAGLPAAAQSDTFDRTLQVSGLVHLQLSNGSGNIEVRGSADGKVHIVGHVSGGWSMMGSKEKNIQEVVANPPIEQHGDTIRIGKSSNYGKNVSIDYQIEVPKDTDLDVSVASGGVTADQIRGPVKVSSASGYAHVYRVEKDVQITTASGDIDAGTIGGYLKASSASGSVKVSHVKGEVKASTASGDVELIDVGDRVEASSASGTVRVDGANSDVRAHSMSGAVLVQGDPSTHRYWELKSVSGSVNLRVPSNSNFTLVAESMSGDIHTTVPVVIEEQSKHSLRAHIGNPEGRVEVHTVSGGISVTN